ncbi:MAG: hypothetical protein PHW96_04230 [Candidatus Nanoarchaeia archaeon]|nr:hypothetical protein [Candidatus Nanoarchaeia archaeon]
MEKKRFLEIIKGKKELKNIDDSTVENALKQLNIDVSKLKEQPKHYKDELKKTRKYLREKYGLFSLPKASKRDKIISIIEYSDDIVKPCLEMLKTHLSSKERLRHYEYIYSKIIPKNTKSISDIACGMNPFSYILIPDYKKIRYFCYELNTSDCNIINRFFKKAEIKGVAEQIDASKMENIKKIPETDVCLLLKTLDTIEEKNKWVSEEIIKNLKSKTIVISFSTKTVSGRSMKASSRLWLEDIIKKLKLNFEIFETDNEKFYVILKNKKTI